MQHAGFEVLVVGIDDKLTGSGTRVQFIQGIIVIYRVPYGQVHSVVDCRC